jgi:putative endonuclease
MAAKDVLGARGEQLAAEHLIRRGLRVLDRNWRSPSGELDLVLRDDATREIVAAEVKTRAGTAYGHPFEAITAAKLARLRRLAGEWCAAHPELAGPRPRVRIDAVAVIAPRDRPPVVEHLRGVF